MANAEMQKCKLKMKVGELQNKYLSGTQAIFFLHVYLHKLEGFSYVQLAMKLSRNVFHNI